MVSFGVATKLSKFTSASVVINNASKTKSRRYKFSGIIFKSILIEIQKDIYIITIIYHHRVI